MASKRQRTRETKAELWWAARYAKATSEAERAGIAWDQARATVTGLPAADQPRAWAALRDALSDIRTGNSHRKFASTGGFNAQRRAGARDTNTLGGAA